MKPCIEYRKVAPGAIEAMSGLERSLTTCGLEPSLLELIKLRASPINGCASWPPLRFLLTGAHSTMLSVLGRADAGRFFSTHGQKTMLW